MLKKPKATKAGSVAVFPYSSLRTADLLIDAVYEGGSRGHVGDDPLDPIMRCGNQGGFRAVGSANRPKLAVLYSQLDDPDWPDFLDIYSGRFTYYGDNKQPGKDLHDTPRGGNLLLRNSFDLAHRTDADRLGVPPFFVFTKGKKGRDVVFRGLAVPGSDGGAEDLVAIWKSTGGNRFQNYKAIFTVLDVRVIRRAWISDLHQCNPLTANAPIPWKKWVETGVTKPLHAPATIGHRKPAEQLKLTANQKALVRCVYEYFRDDPYAFEACAAEIATLMDNRIHITEITQRVRDGGRDAIGTYKFGPKLDQIDIDFALEAKCKGIDSGVGVKELARLISRLRHRQFGILVTTSFLNEQAYEELRDDQHPVMVIAAVDIAQILMESGLGTVPALQQWLNVKFPRLPAPPTT